MPRIRYLKPEFFSDEDLADLKFETRLAYAGLWCFGDKEGRLEDRPKYLKAMIFPYDNIDMEKQLQILSKAKVNNGTPFIIRYSIEGHNFIEIVSWHKHQRPHHTEKESVFPPAPPLIKDKDKDKDKPAQPELEKCNGELTVKRPLKLSDEDFLKSLKEKFTWVDFDSTMIKIDAWLLAHPERKKTRRFIVAWLNKIEKPISIKQTNPIPQKESRQEQSWLKEAIEKGWKA